jgi:Holliday junction resolvase
VTQYDRGRRFEHAVRADLTTNGYDVVRSAGSKTKVDLVAFKTGQVLLIQCKIDGRCSPAERADLLRLAAMLPCAVPVIAWKRPRARAVHYSRITGPGPADRTPWSPDFAGSVVLG